jgi:hypothetical protein
MHSLPVQFHYPALMPCSELTLSLQCHQKKAQSLALSLPEIARHTQQY